MKRFHWRHKWAGELKKAKNMLEATLYWSKSRKSHKDMQMPHKVHIPKSTLVKRDSAEVTWEHFDNPYNYYGKQCIVKDQTMSHVLIGYACRSPSPGQQSLWDGTKALNWRAQTAWPLGMSQTSVPPTFCRCFCFCSLFSTASSMSLLATSTPRASPNSIMVVILLWPSLHGMLTSGPDPKARFNSAASFFTLYNMSTSESETTAQESWRWSKSIQYQSQSCAQPTTQASHTKKLTRLLSRKLWAQGPSSIFYASSRGTKKSHTLIQSAGSVSSSHLQCRTTLCSTDILASACNVVVTWQTQTSPKQAPQEQ